MAHTKTCPACKHQFVVARTSHMIGEIKRFCPNGDCNEEIYYMPPKKKGGPTRVCLIRDKELADKMIALMARTIEERDHVQVTWPGKSKAAELSMAYSLIEEAKSWLAGQITYLKRKEHLDLSLRYSQFMIELVEQRLQEIRDVVDSFRFVRYEWEKTARKILSDMVNKQRVAAQDYVDYNDQGAGDDNREYPVGLRGRLPASRLG